MKKEFNNILNTINHLFQIHKVIFEIITINLILF